MKKIKKVPQRGEMQIIAATKIPHQGEIQSIKNTSIPRQGQIWLVKFKKIKETPKTFRSCMVISGDIQNEFNDLVVVVPLTTDNVENIEPFEVFVKNTPATGLKEPSKIQFIFPMTIDKELRLVEKLGMVSREIMEQAKKAWRIAFDIEDW
ncbi:Toxin, MazF family (modular protein) [endosymbiont DhMRE of Dentiscutata heterogama]|uniref:type II toxin-antitoxin system PemK/MazF family toxin n=1 Tax=endosymbiont DhMRE of Dentiscutata heterogama TaxID=1609546 RepID=UPI000629DC9C|nr:type II toxin-antitoxin system PemK/MazF family toxin [endosymbiont DhMRE of Dentiscutata heterogama]CFW93434.1 Toxin, MazF family (modular protein) [endosymbiont DhMRE of Dentiscutata heterogama]